MKKDDCNGAFIFLMLMAVFIIGAVLVGIIGLISK